jgi:uncharacterized protein YuzE
MKVTLNRQDDALYFRLDEKATIAESDEVEPGVVLDFDEAGRVVAIEILSVSKHVPAAALAQLQFETL